MAAVATVLVASLGALVPALASPAASAAALVAIYAVFATVNILGVERGARVNSRASPSRRSCRCCCSSPAAPSRSIRPTSRSARSAGHGDARAQQHPADLRVRGHRSGARARRRSQGSGAHGAARDAHRHDGHHAALRRRCSSSRRACSARRWRRRRPRRWPTRPAWRWADGRSTLLLVGAVISMLGPRRRDDPGHAAHAVRVRARRIPAGGARAPASGPSHAGGRDRAPVRDRARRSRSPARSNGWRSSRTSSTLVLYGLCCLATWQFRRRDVRARRHAVPRPGAGAWSSCWPAS